MIGPVTVEQIRDSPTRSWRLTSSDVSLVVSEVGATISEVTIASGHDPRRISVDASTQPTYDGASIGRWANRIANSRFDLDGKTYQLEPNEGRHQLHGGPDGFHARRWRGTAQVDDSQAIVTLELASPAGDQGFPGSLTATATIALAGNRISIDYRAVTDAPTPVNLTNHLYWNLGDSTSLDGHQLMVRADRYLPVDDTKIPLPGPPASVDDTRFDCRAPVEVSRVVGEGGYDHCFLLDSAPASMPDDSPQIVLAHRNGARVAFVTNQIGVQVYTGQHFDPPCRALAIETQRPPDMVNRSDLGDPILRPGDEYYSATEIEISA